MTELRTLKDICEEGHTTYCVELRLLKQEAIKWVKSQELNEWVAKPVPLRISLNWIKHFFNLTSEDLNGKE